MTNIANLSNENKETVVAHLNAVIADTFTLYFKTHSYHWNVTGPNFFSLHALFEQQYTEMWQALDELAERVRTLDAVAPVSSKALVEASSIGEATATNAQDMVKALVEGHQKISATLRAALAEVSETGDDVSTDLLTQRLDVHEKA